MSRSESSGAREMTPEEVQSLIKRVGDIENGKAIELRQWAIDRALGVATSQKSVKDLIGNAEAIEAYLRSASTQPRSAEGGGS